MKPGYKQTEVGVIPEEWEANTIGGCCTCFSGGTPSTSNPSYYGGNIAWITSSDLNKERIAEVDGRITEDGLTNSASKIVNKGTLLLALYGATAGVCAISEIQAAINQAVLAISPRRGDIEYLFQFLTFRKDHFIKTYTQGGQPNFSGEIVKSFYVPLPPLPEQRAIATALSDVDGLLGGLDRLSAKKRDLKQAAMQQLLTGQTRLPGFHAEWEVKRLGDVGKCLRGVSYKGDSDLSTHDTPHTKRLLRSNNIQNAIVGTDEVQFVNAARVSSHQILQHYDILICMANGSKALVGKAGNFTLSDGHEYTFGAFMGCFRTNSAEANPTYVFYLFLTARYRDYINNLLAGSSINNLRPSSIESLEFSTPPLPEQTAIASVLTEMDAELAALEQRREKTRALKQAMMQELLTGRTRLL